MGGTHWATEQRQQKTIVDDRWSNNRADGGEDCSLCMVSSILPASWIRWMLVQEDRDLPFIHLARGSPTRWYGQLEPFGIVGAPTRFGVVTYSLVASGDKLAGSVLFSARHSVSMDEDLRLSVRLASPGHDTILSKVQITAGSAHIIAVHLLNSTALFAIKFADTNFNFTASFEKPSK